MNEINLSELIIGSSIEAHLFSLLKNIPITSNKKQYFEFEYYKNPYNLDLLNIKKQKNILQTSKGEKLFGIQKKLLYTELLFYSGLEGRLLFGNSIKNIEHINNNSLQVQTQYGKNMIIKYNKIYIFDNSKIINLKYDIKKNKPSYFIVYDFFKHNKLDNSYKKHDIFYLDDYDFPNKIITHKSSKSTKRVKDYQPITLSKINLSEINKQEFEPYNLQLFIPEVFKKEGFEHRKARGFSLYHTERIKIKKNETEFSSTENISFVYSPIQDLLNMEICDKRVEEIKLLTGRFTCR